MTRHLLLLSLLALCGCGGPGSQIQTGPMPEGGDYTGIWHSEQYGEMQFVQNGRHVVGCYVSNERRGRLQGNVEGRVLRFDWSERREMVSGRPTTSRGRGYFVYSIDEADGGNADHWIRGRWGLDDSNDNGGPWTAVRDRRRTREPDPECRAGSNLLEHEQEGDSFGSETDRTSTPPADEEIPDLE